LREARIDHGWREALVLEHPGGAKRQRHAEAVADQRYPVALAQHLAAANLDQLGLVRKRHALALAARVAQAERALLLDRRVKHVDEHRLVARSRQDHVRQAAQVADVEGAVVRWPVVAYQAGTIHRKRDVEILETDVMDDLVETALQ